MNKAAAAAQKAASSRGLLDSRPKNQLLGPSLPVLLRLISTGFLFSFLGGMQNAEKSMLVTAPESFCLASSLFSTVVPVFTAATLACTIAAQGNGPFPGFLSKQFFAYNGRCCLGLKAINSCARMDSNSPGAIASRRPSTSKLLRTRRYCALSVKSHAPL